MKYDIFISYRRKGGSERAELLKAILEKRGYKGSRVFMDTHNLLGGDFKQRIKDAIAQSVNVIVLITEGCFDSIKEEDYWIFELAEAMSLKKNIVPVFFDGIKDIKGLNLPSTLKELPYQNSVSYNHEYSDAFYSKLCSFLVEDKEHKKSNFAKFAIIGCIAIGTIVASYFLYSLIKDSRKNNVEELIIADAVDLGLPSGTIWCKHNVGSNNEFDMGDLYVWGGVTPVQKQPSLNYDNTTNIIGTSYDVASLRLGGKWQLPSEKQISELIANCKWEWECKDGHIGYMLVGPNGNSIFLPAGGCFIGKEVKYEGEYGYYWIGESNPNDASLAKELLFGMDQINIESGRKNVGRSIRAVYIKE